MRLGIADRGPGIDPAPFETVIEPFFRPDAVRSRVAGGDVASPGEGTDVEGGVTETNLQLMPDDGEASGVFPVGLWDISRDIVGGRDVRYLNILESGIITEYDYAQDELGSGANCYDITSFELVAEGGTRYSIGNVALTIERRDDVLDYAFVDTRDEDGDGDREEVLAFEFPRLEGLSPMDLSSCGI